ncbi:MAG: hypothetical protein ACI9SY_000279 [Candidatus Paceibacteria bacterium]|jgi:hypothetical protein
MKNLFLTFSTICCLLPMAAMSQSISSLCDNGPTLTLYQLPVDASGSISFAAVSQFANPWTHDGLPVASSGDSDEMRWENPLELEVTPIGTPDCLSDDSTSVHRLLTSYGTIDLPSEDMVKITIFYMERAAFDEGTRVEDAYLGQSS